MLKFNLIVSDRMDKEHEILRKNKIEFKWQMKKIICDTCKKNYIDEMKMKWHLVIMTKYYNDILYCTVFICVLFSVNCDLCAQWVPYHF